MFEKRGGEVSWDSEYRIPGENSRGFLEKKTGIFEKLEKISFTRGLFNFF